MKSVLKVVLITSLAVLISCTSVPEQIETVQVYRSDHSRQCQGGGISLQEMQKMLTNITVYTAAKRTLLNVVFPAVCGGETGNVNVYTIAQKDLARAKKLGFEVWQNGR